MKGLGVAAYRGTEEQLKAGVEWLMQKPPYPKQGNNAITINNLSMNNLIYTGPVVDGEPTKYFLKGENGNDTEITKWQYDQLNTASTSGSLSEAEIVRLHQESDPASPYYTGGTASTGGGAVVDKPGVSDAGADGPGTDGGSEVTDESQVPTKAAGDVDSSIQNSADAKAVNDAAVGFTEAATASPTEESTTTGTREETSTVDLTDHPIKSEDLSDPRLTQPAPVESTAEQIEDWFKKEAARIEAYLKSLDNK